MKIVIDTRMYGLENAGIGRYIVNLINEVEKLDKKNDYILLLRQKYFQQLHFSNPKFTKILADYRHYSLKEQFLLPLQLIKLNPDLVHFPHFNAPVLWWGKQVVTVHDLIKHESRGRQTTTQGQWLYWFKYLCYLFLVWLVVKRASRLITPSNWVKEQLVKRYGLDSKKVVVTYEGIGEKFFQKDKVSQSKKILEKYNIKQPFIIYTGSLYPHKNVISLVEAIKKIKNLNLVVVCARNVFWQRFKQQVEKIETGEKVILTGFVDDRELVSLYQQAEAFVFPSVMEGFGLPGLEAMAAGLPVLASNSSCLPEIYGDAALYFNPCKVGEIVEKINKMLANKELKKRMVRLGYEQVKKYSWEKMAQRTMRVYYESCPDL